MVRMDKVWQLVIILLFTPIVFGSQLQSYKFEMPSPEYLKMRGFEYPKYEIPSIPNFEQHLDYSNSMPDNDFSSHKSLGLFGFLAKDKIAVREAEINFVGMIAGLCEFYIDAEQIVKGERLKGLLKSLNAKMKPVCDNQKQIAADFPDFTNGRTGVAAEREKELKEYLETILPQFNGTDDVKYEESEIVEMIKYEVLHNRDNFLKFLCKWIVKWESIYKSEELKKPLQMLIKKLEPTCDSVDDNKIEEQLKMIKKFRKYVDSGANTIYDLNKLLFIFILSSLMVWL